MSNVRLRPAIKGLVFAVMGALAAPLMAAEVPLAADAFVTTAAPATNYGATANLNVGGGASALLRFDLASLPAATLPSHVLKATLVLYVNRIGVAGAVEAQSLDSAWSEATVSAATVPSSQRSGTAPSSAVTTAGQYITLDVTAQVVAWIAAGGSSNFGFLIQPAAGAPATSVFFDSKENTLTGHAARLDLTLTGQGPVGAEGLPGPAGPAGPSTAVAGPAGAAGLPGPKGDPGATGSAGAPGAPGLPGPMGATGSPGPAGAMGPNGAAGQAGATGAPGTAGIMGVKGDSGPAGAVGMQGLTGSTGPVGAAGAAGATGPTGPAGPTGATGAGGAAGIAGPAGPQGPVGSTGADGARGPTGPTGTAGPAGLGGAAGATGATGATGSTGLIGDTGPAGAKGATGPSGPGGVPGPAGPAAMHDLLGMAPSLGFNDGRVIDCTVGAIKLFAGSVGEGMAANGQLLPINQYQPLFALIGTKFGGNGSTTFALPNLRSVTPNGLQYYICHVGVFPSLY